MILGTFTKHPDDILDYEIDWDSTDNGGPWLAAGETISTSVWSVPAGITNVADDNSTTVTTIRLSGGTDQSDYQCDNVITTSTGQVKVASIVIQARETEDVLLDATVGGASSNSYGTVAEGDAYFQPRLNTATWDAATVEDKERALITTAAEFEEMDFVGFRFSVTQSLSFPRYMVPKRDAYSGSIYYSTDEIPPPIKYAQFERANELLDGTATDSAAVGSLKSVNMGDMLTVEFDNAQSGVLSSRIASLLRGFWLNSSGVPMVRS